MEQLRHNLRELPINRMGLYVVQHGDSIQSIAARHNLPSILLICSNNLKGEPSVGSMLVLPKSSGRLYTVQVGESVESVCQKFCISREEFIQKNGCNYIFPGLLVLL